MGNAKAPALRIAFHFTTQRLGDCLMSKTTACHGPPRFMKIADEVETVINPLVIVMDRCWTAADNVAVTGVGALRELILDAIEHGICPTGLHTLHQPREFLAIARPAPCKAAVVGVCDQNSDMHLFHSLNREKPV